MSAAKDKFIYEVKNQLGKVHEVASLKKVPGKVREIASALGLEAKAAVAPDPAFQGLDWRGLAVSFRGAVIEDVLGISRARFGIAETGSVVFCSSPASPPSLNFVPEYSIAVVAERDIVAASEDVWAALLEGGGVPATLNVVSGPSRTGDIEQTMFFGAHGPRELHVVIVKN